MSSVVDGVNKHWNVCVNGHHKKLRM